MNPKRKQETLEQSDLERGLGTIANMDERLDHEMNISALPVGDKAIDCSGIIQWSKNWDWGVGEIVAERLSCNSFTDWETVFVATVNQRYAALCILEKKDAWGTDLDDALTPFITAVYVDPKFRGRRISEKLLEAACNFARSLGFGAVYLISGEEGLYEKFGFEKFTQTVTLLGTTEPVYIRSL